MKIFYLDSLNDIEEEKEITTEELSEALSKCFDTIIELDEVDNEGNLHFQHTCYGMYY